MQVYKRILFCIIPQKNITKGDAKEHTRKHTSENK